LVIGFLDAVAGVQKLALRTQDRYKAALDRFLDFCKATDVKTIDALTLATVEDFVKWLRGQRRTRNGSVNGSRASYKIGGIKFILSTCRTTLNWAGRRRMLPPYHENPFKLFPIDKLKDPNEERTSGMIFTPEQGRAFFAACDVWQKRLFTVLGTYGLRVAELTHLLIEDVDLSADTFSVPHEAVDALEREDGTGTATHAHSGVEEFMRPRRPKPDELLPLFPHEGTGHY
jgi:site-specific recombinase XerD